ncbi:MAG: class I SAM-dependent methyltransferase [Chloroflexi bacterium]|nr:class I SAM-dependent methyltransferase [Chloroflexota bacterium]
MTARHDGPHEAGETDGANRGLPVGQRTGDDLPLRWHVLDAVRVGRPDGAGEARTIGFWVPDCSLDDLFDAISPGEFARTDERMPYFAALWPAADSLAAYLLSGETSNAAPLAGWRVLDLGCGVGACGFAAAGLGAHVTFFDWEPRAIEIVTASARAQGQPPAAFQFVTGDWRMPPLLGSFDLILAADVLYEQRNVRPVAVFLARHLAPGGGAWLADPGRPHTEAFLSLAREMRLTLLGREWLPSRPHGADVMLMRLRQLA